mmetsp:Transcript_64915/g.135356  ORF Transcript_64915/g.135356 Transcript_64915/m.135356 type:complete len:221 (+) Transcript_64915:1168-1830(+)
MRLVYTGAGGEMTSMPAGTWIMRRPSEGMGLPGTKVISIQVLAPVTYDPSSTDACVSAATATPTGGVTAVSMLAPLGMRVVRRPSPDMPANDCVRTTLSKSCTRTPPSVSVPPERTRVTVCSLPHPKRPPSNSRVPFMPCSATASHGGTNTKPVGSSTSIRPSAGIGFSERKCTPIGPSAEANGGGSIDTSVRFPTEYESERLSRCELRSPMPGVSSVTV